MFGLFARSTKEEIGQFAEAFGLTFPVGRERGLSTVLGAKEIPVIFFISKEGVITGELNEGFSSEELRAGIEEIVE